MINLIGLEIWRCIIMGKVDLDGGVCGGVIGGGTIFKVGGQIVEVKNWRVSANQRDGACGCATQGVSEGGCGPLRS